MGRYDSAPVNFRALLKGILESNACRVIVFHNHPGGSMNPSEPDLRTTGALAGILRQLDVQLADAYVVTSDDYLSILQYVRENRPELLKIPEKKSDPGKSGDHH